MREILFTTIAIFTLINCQNSTMIEGDKNYSDTIMGFSLKEGQNAKETPESILVETKQVNTDDIVDSIIKSFFQITYVKCNLIYKNRKSKTYNLVDTSDVILRSVIANIVEQYTIDVIDDNQKVVRTSIVVTKINRKWMYEDPVSRKPDIAMAFNRSSLLKLDYAFFNDYFIYIDTSDLNTKGKFLLSNYISTYRDVKSIKALEIAFNGKLEDIIN